MIGQGLIVTVEGDPFRVVLEQKCVLGLFRHSGIERVKCMSDCLLRIQIVES